jgi:hypothetical protein
MVPPSSSSADPEPVILSPSRRNRSLECDHRLSLLFLGIPQLRLLFLRLPTILRPRYFRSGPGYGLLQRPMSSLVASITLRSSSKSILRHRKASSGSQPRRCPPSENCFKSYDGPKRFGEFERNLGAAKNILATRPSTTLADLAEGGLRAASHSACIAMVEAARKGRGWLV